MQTSDILRSLQPSYIREILSAASAPGVISLAGGLPAGDRFPMAMMSDALANLGQKPELFQYGQTAGYQPLLDAVRLRFQVDSNLESIVCTGSQQALDLAARAFLDPGDVVVMEVPSYLGALQVFALAGAVLSSVEQTPTGPDMSQLENALSADGVKLFYAVPDFHNPTGVRWSLETRKQVSTLCRKLGVVLLEDCPYRDIRFAGESLPMVSSFDPENAIVLRSFSKTVAPGIRLGIATALPEIIAPMIKVKQVSDLHSNIPLQAVLADVLLNPKFEQHIGRIIKIYSSRYQALTQMLKIHLSQCVFEQVEGGMFVWLKLPEECNAMNVAKTAIEQQNVAVVPGDVFFPETNFQDAKNKAFLRLNFSNTREEQFSAAIARLSNCF